MQRDAHHDVLDEGHSAILHRGRVRSRNKECGLPVTHHKNPVLVEEPPPFTHLQESEMREACQCARQDLLQAEHERQRNFVGRKRFVAGDNVGPVWRAQIVPQRSGAALPGARQAEHCVDRLTQLLLQRSGALRVAVLENCGKCRRRRVILVVEVVQTCFNTDPLTRAELVPRKDGLVGNLPHALVERELGVHGAGGACGRT